jgi:hypothetical protein
MKKITLLALVAIVLLATSCSKNFYSHRSVNVERKDFMVTPVVADINVDFTKKYTATSTKQKSVNAAKDMAYYKAVTENNIDVLVDPIYNIEQTDKILFWGGKVTASISGFGAKYTTTKKLNDVVRDYNMDSNTIKNFKNLYQMQTNTGISRPPAEASSFDKAANIKKSKVGLLLLAAAGFLLLKTIL